MSFEALETEALRTHDELVHAMSDLVGETGGTTGLCGLLRTEQRQELQRTSLIAEAIRDWELRHRKDHGGPIKDRIFDDLMEEVGRAEETINEASNSTQEGLQNYRRSLSFLSRDAYFAKSYNESWDVVKEAKRDRNYRDTDSQRLINHPQYYTIENYLSYQVDVEDLINNILIKAKENSDKSTGMTAEQYSDLEKTLQEGDFTIKGRTARNQKYYAELAKLGNTGLEFAKVIFINNGLEEE